MEASNQHHAGPHSQGHARRGHDHAAMTSLHACECPPASCAYPAPAKGGSDVRASEARV